MLKKGDKVVITRGMNPFFKKGQKGEIISHFNARRGDFEVLFNSGKAWYVPNEFMEKL